MSRELSDGLQSRKRLGVGGGVVDGGGRRGHVENASLAILAGDKEVLALSRIGNVEREVAEVDVVEAGRGLERVEDGHVLRGSLISRV